MTNSKEVTTLEGTVLRKFPTETGKSQAGKFYTRNKFILRTIDNRDLYITKFGTFESSLIGKDVKFQATRFNDTNFTVQGEVEEHEIVEPVTTQNTTESTASNSNTTTVSRKRGRPSKVVETTAPPANSFQVAVLADPIPAPAVETSLEEQARNLVVSNLKKAENVLISLLRKDYTTADIIAVGDMLGRTYVSLRIEQNKDNRMDKFNARR